MTDTAIRFFQEGGFFMYPIALVLLIGSIVAIERFIYLSAQRRGNQRDFRQLMHFIGGKDIKKALQYAHQSDTPMSRMIGAGLHRFNQNQPRPDIEYAMEEGLVEAVPRLEKRTPYLATLANVSTLLGLLGTIIGLIAAFTAVASADPAEKASLLSQSISVAMNTTAFGLISAIPLLLLHSLLQTATNEIVDSFEMAGIKVMNLLSGGHLPASSAAGNPAARGMAAAPQMGSVQVASAQA